MWEFTFFKPDWRHKKRDMVKQTIIQIAIFLGIIILLLSAFLALYHYPMGQETPVLVDFDNSRVKAGAPVEADDEKVSFFRVAIASMISPEDTTLAYGEMLDYLGDKLGIQIKVMQRRTYREVNSLIETGAIDLGFICAGAYARALPNGVIKALVIPVVAGDAHYRAYIIVPRKSAHKELLDLKDGTFAYTDPDSMTGCLYPRVLLKRLGAAEETFFSRTIFTYNHTDSIHAVSHQLVDGASVDSLVYDFYLQRMPDRVQKTRILEVSEPFDIPPVVVGPQIPPTLREKMLTIFIHMHLDPTGREILTKMNIDKYILPNQATYKKISAIIDELEGE